MSKKLNVLIVGSGGREHAIGSKIHQSPLLGKLYFAPGNGGTSLLGSNVSIKATDVEGLLAFAFENEIDLTIVGPEDPLGAGIVDAFRSCGLRIFGPTKAAAELELSKLFAKGLMLSANVPTGSYMPFTEYSPALQYVQGHFAGDAPPIVVKASGPALGKGAYVCPTLEEAELALHEIMVQRIHGSAGDEVVIEEFIPGEEVSMLALCDGNDFKLFPPAQDHKRAFDGDMGPNTGGMGAVAGLPWFKSEAAVCDRVVAPILAAMRERKTPYTGAVFPGLMMKGKDPVVLEINARFGDPETQVWMRLLRSDLLEILMACADGRLNEVEIEWMRGFAACVVLASEGYPSSNYKKGLPITGIEDAEKVPGVRVFHAGTKVDGGVLQTSGGRVLSVTCIGSTLESAIADAYRGVECIRFDGMQYRKDIGARALRRI